MDFDEVFEVVITMEEDDFERVDVDKVVGLDVAGLLVLALDDLELEVGR